MATNTYGNRLLIRQTKEWGEIFTGFETRNRYELLDEGGARMGFAAEEGRGLGALFRRSLLGRLRACKIHVRDAGGNELVRGEKPFRWYFHRMDAFKGEAKLGAIQRRFSLLHRVFVLENAQGREMCRIHSPLFRIWTFKVLFQDRQVGVIRKKWGGVLREMFTDADTFGIEYGDAVADLRDLLIVATFLIDFTCFENNRRR